MDDQSGRLRRLLALLQVMKLDFALHFAVVRDMGRDQVFNFPERLYGINLAV